MCGYRYVLDLKHSTYSKYHECWEKAATLVAQQTLNLWEKAGISRDETDRERLSIVSNNTWHCVENLFKKGSPLSLRQQYKEVKRLVFADRTVFEAVRKCPNPTRSKQFALFKMCVFTHSAMLITSLYWLIDRVKRI